VFLKIAFYVRAFIHVYMALVRNSTRANRGRYPGMVMIITGLSLMSYYVADSIFVWSGMRPVYIDDVVSAARLIVGSLLMLGGIWV
jgi:hypothetical protein